MHTPRALGALVLVIVLAAPALGAARDPLAPQARLSSTLVQQLDDPVERLLTVTGPDGAALARTVAARGVEVIVVGSHSVDVRASPRDALALSVLPGVTFVEHAVPLRPASVTEVAAALRAPEAHAAGRTGAADVLLVDLGFDAATVARAVAARSFDGASVDAGDTSHGTAAAAALLAVAPDARLHLARASTPTGLEAALRWAAELGVDVVSVAVGSPIGPFDGSSDVSRAAADAVAAGIVVLSATGDGARHHWGGAWADADRDGDLDVAPGDDALRVTLKAGETFDVILSWNGTPRDARDYDIYLYTEDRKVPLAWSTGYQSGSQPLRERVTYTPPADAVGQLVVRGYANAGATRFHLHLDARAAPLAEHAVADGSLLAPADAPGVLSVGAGDVAAPHAAPAWSARGPTDDGRAAPTLVGPASDGGSFVGTSAAVSFVAGAAALVRAEQPGLAPAAVARALGGGWVDAFAAVASADVTPLAVASATFDRAGPVGAGALGATILFNDDLGPARGAVSLVAADGRALPFVPADRGARSWSGTVEVPADLANGRATLRIEVFEEWNGRKPAFPEGPSIVIDTRPPVVTLAPLPPVASPPFDVAWNATDAQGLSTVRLEVQVGDGAWTPWLTTPESAGSAAWTNATEGAAHRFRAIATDAAGNSATTGADVAPTLADATPPRVVATRPASGTVVTDARASLEVTLADATAGVDPTSIRFDLDDARVSAAFDERTGVVRHVPVSPLATGAHDARVVARDRAGNIVEAAWSFEVAPPPAPGASPLRIAAAAAPPAPAAAPESPEETPDIAPGADLPPRTMRWQPPLDVELSSTSLDEGEVPLEASDADLLGTGAEAATIGPAGAPETPAPRYAWLAAGLLVLLALLVALLVLLFHPRLWRVRERLHDRIERLRQRAQGMHGWRRVVLLRLLTWPRRRAWQHERAQHGEATHVEAGGAGRP